MKASMLTKMFAVITCINLAALPVYAQEVTLGDHTIDVTGIETVCDHPELLDGAISETYNELLAENPEVAEFFTQEITELAETVTDIPLEEATVEVVEAVAEVAPQLVQSITQTQEGTANIELAGLVQNFLETAPQVLTDQPAMLNMLNAVDQQLEFSLANIVFQEAGVENMGEFMKNIMEQSGGDPEAMKQAAEQFFAQHGGDFMPMFDQGAPDFILAQCETMGNFFEIIETHGQELFAGGDFDPARMQEVVGASFEITPEMMAMMDRFGDGMEFQPGEFTFSPEMFMDHVFEGGGDYQGFPMMEGDQPWGPEGMMPPEGMDPSVMGPEFWGMDPSQFDPSQMEAFVGQEFEAYFADMDQQMQDQFHEWENNNEQIENMNQDQQQQMQDWYNSPACVEHRGAAPHDGSTDGHMGC